MADDPRPKTLPPEDLEPDPGELVLEWAEALDRIDYLSLLGLPRPTSIDQVPSDDAVRDGFRAFALAFHPDRHLDAEPEVRDAATRVFRRGAEAYRVLQDPLLRRRYVRLLVEEGALRLQTEELEQARSSRGPAPSRVQDLIKSASARPFAERADELIAAGDFGQAKLQLQLAVMREPQNARLKEKLDELERKVTSLRPPRA